MAEEDDEEEEGEEEEEKKEEEEEEDGLPQWDGGVETWEEYREAMDACTARRTPTQVMEDAETGVVPARRVPSSGAEKIQRSAKPLSGVPKRQPCRQ